MSDFYFIIGASRPKGAGVKNLPVNAHMFFEDVDYSHIHIEFPPGLFSNETVYFEARNSQVNFVNEKTFLEKTKVVRSYAVYCNEAEIGDILERVKNDLLGGMYGSNIRDFNGNTVGEWEFKDR